MSESLVMHDTSPNPENQISSPLVSAGQMLKQARQDAGLHIAALAVSLRVPVKRIEALENGQMDLLPDMVFVRALTSSICQALKVDAAPILEKLPKAARPLLNHDDVAINTPIGTSGTSKGELLTGFFTSPWLMGVVFLCIGAAGIYFWPQASTLAASELVLPSKNLSESGVNQAKEQQVVIEKTAAPSPNQAASTGASPAETNNVQPNAVLPQLSAVPADSIVIFKASAETWVEVKNAAGSTMFKKLLMAGETAGATGSLPLTVIVGRADATVVEVRGKAIDLAAIAKSNVARFEVN